MKPEVDHKIAAQLAVTSREWQKQSKFNLRCGLHKLGGKVANMPARCQWGYPVVEARGGFGGWEDEGESSICSPKKLHKGTGRRKW